MGIGVTEWLVILVIVLVLFGGKKLPELMGGLGKGLRNFKKELNRPDEIDVTPEQKKIAAGEEAAKQTAQSAQKNEAGKS